MLKSQVETLIKLETVPTDIKITENVDICTIRNGKKIYKKGLKEREREWVKVDGGQTRHICGRKTVKYLCKLLLTHISHSFPPLSSKFSLQICAKCSSPRYKSCNDYNWGSTKVMQDDVTRVFVHYLLQWNLKINFLALLTRSYQNHIRLWMLGIL